MLNITADTENNKNKQTKKHLNLQESEMVRRCAKTLRQIILEF